MKLLFITPVLLGLMTACGTASSPGPQVRTERSAATDFSSYRTFTFRLAGQPSAPFKVSARAFEVERRMRPLIVAGLAQKGYTEAVGQTKPDFVIAFASGYSEEPTRATSPAQGGGPGLADGVPIDRGEIVIDAFDSSNDTQVWHGTAETEVDHNNINDALLQAAVQRTLASFPSRPGVTAPQGP
jgi:hypothetical protein